jgi:hypothetical protein
MRGFLIERLGEEQGGRIALRQAERLSQLLGQVKGKSKNQTRTLKKDILPYVALYQVLQEARMDTRTLDDYLVHLASAQGRRYRLIERLPFSFAVIRMLATQEMKADNWEVTFDRNDEHMLQFTVTKCLWHDTCVELGCPEICETFCDGDDLTLGSMKTIAFRRSKTLGKGGDSCDFHLINNRNADA